MKRIDKVLTLFTAFIVGVHAYASGSHEPFEATEAWFDKIEAIAPSGSVVPPKEKRTALVFSLMTGFKHWCTPHTAGVVQILGEKSGAYEVVISDDLSHFEPDNIKRFDLIVLNNNCSTRPGRHLFFDALGDMEKALALENSLLEHIASGNGLAVFHGGIVMLNESDDFSAAVGGSFDFHPKQQVVTGLLVEPEHPITSAFEGRPLVHFDEPYYFNRAYHDFNFRPLLEMKLEEGQGKEADSVKRYISWVKSYGNGRVFYCSPSHNAQSFEQASLLQFMLNGLQYAAGDLECDDEPLSAQ